MDRFKVIYWQEENYLMGYIEDYPDFQTQGETIEELKENIIDIYNEIRDGNIPNVKKANVMELLV